MLEVCPEPAWPCIADYKNSKGARQGRGRKVKMMLIKGGGKDGGHKD